MLQPGQVIGGRLRIERILGKGGMGIVAAATHLELRQEVAVKVLHDELAQHPTIVERFLREARASAAIASEHVCRVFDVGRLESGAPYIVMEMLTGADLASTIARSALPVPIAVEYIVQACVAIGEAHAKGIIHRDIKPANLFVSRRADGGPLVKVLDFGIAQAAHEARLTATTSQMGSPGFMSPEQLLSSHGVDARSDLWSLGVTLYQLVSRRMPFPANTITEIAIKVQSSAPAPLGEVDPALAAIVLRCMEKDPAKRFQSVAELVAVLAPFGGAGAIRYARPATGLPVTPVPTAAAPVAAAAPTVGTVGGAAVKSHVPATTVGGAAGAVATGVDVRRGGGGRGVLLAIAAIVLVGGGVAVGWLGHGHGVSPSPTQSPSPNPNPSPNPSPNPNPNPNPNPSPSPSPSPTPNPNPSPSPDPSPTATADPAEATTDPAAAGSGSARFDPWAPHATSPRSPTAPHKVTKPAPKPAPNPGQLPVTAQSAAAGAAAIAIARQQPRWQQEKAKFDQALPGYEKQIAENDARGNKDGNDHARAALVGQACAYGELELAKKHYALIGDSTLRNYIRQACIGVGLVLPP